MKKSLFAALLAALLVLCAASCGVTVTDYTVVIRNNSAKNVKFDYNGVKNIDILSNPSSPPSYTDTVRAHTPMPSNISVPGVQSVKISSSSDGYVFEDRESLALNITNTLSREIKIKAGEWLEDAAGTKTEITVPANGNISGAKIYTRTPHFEIVGNTGSSAQCDWEIPDTAPNTMNVTVK